MDRQSNAKSVKGKGSVGIKKSNSVTIAERQGIYTPESISPCLEHCAAPCLI